MVAPLACPECYSRLNLADKQMYSGSMQRSPERHKLAESARIGQFLAESTNSVNGFDRRKRAHSDTRVANKETIVV